jgi:hypothetical protein
MSPSLPLMVLALSMIGASREPGRVDVEAIRAAATANREAFRQGVFRFRRIEGTNSSWDEARRGEAERVIVWDGLLAIRDGLTRHDLLPTEATLELVRKVAADRESKPKFFGPVSSLMAFRMVSDGKKTMQDNLVEQPDGSFRHQVDIQTGDYWFQGMLRFPLGLGAPGPNRFELTLEIAMVDEGKSQVVSVGKTEIYEGESVVRLTLSSGKRVVDFWIDMKRGAVPRKYRSAFEGREINVWNDDLQFHEGGGWLPHRFTSTYTDGGFMHLAIDAVDLSRPSDAAFTLEFDKPTRSNDSVRRVSLPPMEKLSLLKLPSPGMKGVKAFPKASHSGVVYNATPPPREGERVAGSNRGLYLAVAVAGLAVVVVAGVVAGRKTRRG